MEHQTLKRALLFVEIVFALSAIISCIVMVAAKLTFWLTILPLIGVICSITIIETLKAILDQVEHNNALICNITNDPRTSNADTAIVPPAPPVPSVQPPPSHRVSYQRADVPLGMKLCRACGCTQKSTRSFCIECGEKF